ncbi:hypothetical protein CFT61_03880 [Segatella copri]|uniref:DEAD/DEAH box helicase n=1 Tax=Segatella copri TaxID=165179 RepID=A0AA91YXN3_9BACT|nr:DEAD/DEAH box helicase [Segatella copri]OXL44819.1 hypothetical protein CFT61_03880 [Segatella copri]
MDYAKFYTDANKALVDSLVSTWVPGHKEEQNYLRELLTQKEPLIAPPVFQTIFPWKSSSMTFLEHATKQHVLDEKFVRAIGSIEDEEYRFPLDRAPYTHQTNSWKTLLNDKKTIVVTSGTGSGKTECFMIPVIQDLYRQKSTVVNEGVQAIFIYPLNALMKNQQRRVHAWCSALSPKVTYAIYNGDTPEDIQKNKALQAHPQLLSRRQIRETPPQILFTNPTMLNYMLVRPEDQCILKKSQGKLRWILLDEAHTYTGSSAAELSLQIRRILDAFGVTIEQVNFALTSATIGDPKDPKTATELKQFVSDITGKAASDIEIIDGKRIIPDLNNSACADLLGEINKEFSGKATIGDIEGLRKKINKEPSLALSAISNVFNKKLSREESLRLVNKLGEKIMGLNLDGSAGALLPSRIHFFIRSIRGIYVCTNPDCKTHKGSSINFGSLTTYQNTTCPSCQKPLLEIATCPHCGGTLLVGEQSNDKNEAFRMRVNTTKLNSDIFDYVSDEEDTKEDAKSEKSNSPYSPFILAKEPNKCPRNNVQENVFTISTDVSRINAIKNDDGNGYKECWDQYGKNVCPHCGGSIDFGKIQYFRASATFMGRILAPILLDNAEPAADQNDLELIYEGRKFITFTDSRQNTAKSAMTLNQDVERNWIRTAIYHNLCEVRLQDYNPGGGLSKEEEAQYQAFKTMPMIPAPLMPLFKNLEDKRMGNSKDPSPTPVSWESIEKSLEKNIELKKMFKHLGEARSRGVNGIDFKPTNYLRALYVDQFGWIPKHSNSLETLGLVKVVYPTLKGAKVPTKLAARSFTDSDWQDFLKICLDYYIRGNRHYALSESYKFFLTQTDFSSPIYPSRSDAHYGNRKVSKWQTVTLSEKGKVKESQNRIVLLLCAALNINSTKEFNQENIDLINSILQDAWKYLTQNVLEEVDREKHGYILDLLDKDKVKIQLMDKAYVCPVDNVFVDTLFRGFSPRISGYISKSNFDRFKIDESSELHFPMFPYPKRQKKTSDGIKSVSDQDITDWVNKNLQEIKNRGLLNNLIINILHMQPIFIAGEHSGQQQRQVLDKYEEQFNKGYLNILSCSTTMEMGVDLKGISEVVMNDVPPKPANYLQRAGRAGRRMETKALALTFCAPNPIGMSAWNNPGWSMAHITQMAQVRLESVQIIQRQVNSYLFSTYVASRGGIRVKATIENFFGGDVSSCDLFCDFLDDILNHQSHYQALLPKYAELVKGSILAVQDLESSTQKCKAKILKLKKEYGERVEIYDKIIEDTEGAPARQRYAVTNSKNNFVNSSLMPWLAENNFLPSAGIPTGLVEFTSDLDRAGKTGAKMPTLHMSHAVSAYAPGNKVIINEWCYEPSGITLKSRFDSTKKNVIQYCDHCHYTTIVYGKPLDECPSCHQLGTMHGLSNMTIGTNHFTEIVEPAGFTVGWDSKPTRVLKNDNAMNLIQPVLLKMEPWSENEHEIKFKMRSGANGSEILFYNKGKGYGYALCPYCGRMKVEDGFAGASDDKHPLALHKHLLAGKECQGTENDGANIRRNVLLVGRYQTDLVEIKFYDVNSNPIIDPNTLYSLGAILSRKLTEILGINDGEIDFGYNKSYNSIFIYDTALGGSGYSPLLFDYKDEVFKAAYDALKGCNCDKACTNCLIDRNTQWYLNYLDRHAALSWLTMEVESREVDDNIKKICPDAKKVTSDLTTELYHLMRSNMLDSLSIFISGKVENWEADTFPFAHNIKELSLNDIKINYVLDKKINFKLLPADQLTSALNMLYKEDIYVMTDQKDVHPLIMLSFKSGEHKIYFSNEACNDFNDSWGQAANIFISTEDFPKFTVEKIDKEAIIHELTTSNSQMFEEYITKDLDSNTLLDGIVDSNPTQWEQIGKYLSSMQHVRMNYSDRYLNSPLGCILLASLIKQLKRRYGLKVDRLTIMRSSKENAGYVPTYYNIEDDDTFTLEKNFKKRNDCDQFLQKCMSEIANTPVEIKYELLPHYRSLTIQSEKYDVSIRPDGGIAYGWDLDRSINPGITYSEIKNNLGQSLALHNKVIRSGGILYTIAAKEK